MASTDLSRLMKFLRQEEWAERFDDVQEEHFGEAFDAFDVDFEALEELIGPQTTATLWGCAFEDLMTRRFEPDGANLVDAYLKRRGWNEKGPAKAYMQALRDSVVSLYEVSEIVPGQSMLARDMLRAGEPILVHERSATRSLKQWDRIAARIVSASGKNVLSGGVLPFSRDAAEQVLDGIAVALAKQGGVEVFDTLDANAMLADIAPLFTTAWLFDTLGQILDPAPVQLFTSEGDPVLFHTLHWPITKGSTQAQIAEQLNRIDALVPEGAKLWNWVETEPAAPLTGTGGQRWDVSMDDGTRVLGQVELKGRFLTLSVSSAARADRGKALMGELLGDRVGVPKIEVRTLEELRAEAADSAPAAPALDMPPEEMARLLQDMMDKHYRATLDLPVAMLDGQTPRAAAANPAGRDSVVQWLKLLENGSARHGADDPMGTYDFSWMWRELGLEALRR